MKNKNRFLYNIMLGILIGISVADVVLCYVLENSPIVPLILAISMVIGALTPVPFLIASTNQIVQEV